MPVGDIDDYLSYHRYICRSGIRKNFKLVYRTPTLTNFPPFITFHLYQFSLTFTRSFHTQKIIITLTLRCLYASKRIFDTCSDDSAEEYELCHNLYKNNNNKSHQQMFKHDSNSNSNSRHESSPRVNNNGESKCIDVFRDKCLTKGVSNIAPSY